MNRIEIPSPPQMAQGDIIARHAKRNIGVGGVPFVLNLDTKKLRWGDEDVDPEDIISLSRRLISLIHPETDKGRNMTFVGVNLDPAEILDATEELKFSGVEAWLRDRFSDEDERAQAKAILDKARESIDALWKK